MRFRSYEEKQPAGLYILYSYWTHTAWSAEQRLPGLIVILVRRLSFLSFFVPFGTQYNATIQPGHALRPSHFISDVHDQRARTTRGRYKGKKYDTRESRRKERAGLTATKVFYGPHPRERVRQLNGKQGIRPSTDDSDPWFQ